MNVSTGINTGATLWLQHLSRYTGIGNQPSVHVDVIFRDLPGVI